jgi:hypothetical protein
MVDRNDNFPLTRPSPRWGEAKVMGYIFPAKVGAAP